MAKIEYVYFDSCVFLAYFNDETGRADIIEQLFDEISADANKLIVTSSISITEVAFITGEKRLNKATKLKPDSEGKFDLVWADTTLVRFVDFQENLARKARTLMRDASEKNYALKPPDAIHLVSAQFVGVSEFFTYDDLQKYAEFLNFDIKEPYVLNKKMFTSKNFDESEDSES